MFLSPWNTSRTPFKGRWVPNTPGKDLICEYGRNPHKGLVTLDEDGKILMTNDLLRVLLEIPDERDLLGKDFFKEIVVKDKGLESLDETELLPDGSTFHFSGAVVELLKQDGSHLPVSLWITPTSSGKQIILIQNVERKVAEFLVSSKTGLIISSDSVTRTLFGLDESTALDGKCFNKFLPHIPTQLLRELQSEEGSFRSKTTGKTLDGVHFPAALHLIAEEEERIRCIVWIFSSLSGLIVMNSEGKVRSCNSNFTHLLFGYKEEELVNKRIEDLIPTIYEDCDIVDMIPDKCEVEDGEEEDEDLGCTRFSSGEEENEEAEGDSYDIAHHFEEKLHLSSNTLENESRYIKSTTEGGGNNDPNESAKNDLFKLASTPVISKYSGAEISRYSVNYRVDEAHNFPEGSFFGLGRHKNGDEIAILYQIRRVTLNDGSSLYCLWLSREPEDHDGGKQFGSLTLESTFDNSPDESLGQAIRNVVEKQKKAGYNRSITFKDDELHDGEYSDRYHTLHEIGKGGFGCVKSAYRIEDGLMVITKFIKKSKIYEEYWIQDKVLGKTVSLEISLLTTLCHPNIVSIIDVFENENYFQMVMAKHGPGMDLFEFIDRRPKMGEDLASYIFRQVVSAVDYLHERDIIHRDIKDENIIIDKDFTVKLVDFGSATFIKPGWLFSTFYGTVEYCSPEVLSGYHYRGPELEVWTLGILLYIIMFGENPFFTIDETIQCQLFPPFAVSPPCIQLVKSILIKDPKYRFTLSQIKNHPWACQEIDLKSYKFEEVISCSK
ncbi:PAS domain-containing serine/threonine-protein kinase isoform X2 [Lepeophtheirus salmonis]|nr:PAS domain-containing serine/threonine-protein kinase-like isoform X2 [Lepeophtheirus salmonis]